MPVTRCTPAPKALDFTAFLTEAFAARGSRTHATDYGVNETALLRYTSGAVSMYERKEIEGIIARNDWARNYNVGHMKHRRRKRSAA